MYNSFTPRLKITNVIDNRITEFKVEGTNLEGIALSASTLIRYHKNAILNFNPKGVIVKTINKNGNLSVVSTGHITIEKVEDLSIDSKYVDFLFYFKVEKISGSPSEKDLLESPDENPIFPTSRKYDEINAAELIEEFKFNINKGDYDFLVKEEESSILY
jgi:hypothetical protein